MSPKDHAEIFVSIKYFVLQWTVLFVFVFVFVFVFCVCSCFCFVCLFFSFQGTNWNGLNYIS